MSCTFWIQRKKKAAQLQEQENLKAQEKENIQEDKPAKKTSKKAAQTKLNIEE